MSINLVSEIEKSKFLLVLMQENEYDTKLEELVKVARKKKTKICYICLSTPYSDISDSLKEKGLDAEDFFFIDVISSCYKKMMPQKNCIFLSPPVNLEDLKTAIAAAIKNKNCTLVIFDTISALLIYEQVDSIVKFTHNLISEKMNQEVKKMFIIVKDNKILAEESDSLQKDLEMFADKTLDLSLKKK
jgi:archaellum biogenesis ATPase FlaH